MTAIAAFTDGRTAALAYDSGTEHQENLMLANLAKRPRVHDIVSPKGKPRGRLVLASCGLHRVTNEIVNRWTPPTRTRSTATVAYMLDVGASLQEHMAAAGDVVMDGRFLDGEFVAICDGRVFGIGECFSVFEPTSGLLTAGSGGYVALGAMAALDEHLAPADVVRRAVEIACEHVPGIIGPIHVETTTA